jgi:adenine-specific DNA-methyltransferase
MSTITDLINRIPDKALKDRLLEEIKKSDSKKKYGLVFEDHLPDSTPLYNVPVQPGHYVALKGKPIDRTLFVVSVKNDDVECVDTSTKEIIHFSKNDLYSVGVFNEPLFPTLTHVDSVENDPSSTLWHTLIQADNYYALELLEYLYPQQVDCIYIDPPYNTGASDWKYNNAFVDDSDAYKPSKWLSMMSKRLVLAKKVLNPKTGVLICTIDEHEIHHLRCLLEEIFPEAHIQMVTIVVNPKGVSQEHFARVEEYAIYVFMPEAEISDWPDKMLGENETDKHVTWASLLRRGNHAKREERPHMYYPILINSKDHRVVKAGEELPLGTDPEYGSKIDGYDAAWPVRTNLSQGTWSVKPSTLNELISKGYVSLGKYDEKRKTWAISYLFQKQRSQIENGEIVITGKDPITGTVQTEYSSTRSKLIKTVWFRASHDAGTYGSDLVSEFVGKAKAFPFPKSVFAERDSIGCVVKNNKNALILDFFAGSGTTLNAVNLLNKEDGGHRRCIIVTNNEVSKEDSKKLEQKGLFPGMLDWEKEGICKSVTWPRTVNSIKGKTEDGKPLKGNYLLSTPALTKEPKVFVQYNLYPDSFLSSLDKSEMVCFCNLLGLDSGDVDSDTQYIIDHDRKTAVLFDKNGMQDFCDEINEINDIEEFILFSKEKKTFAEEKKEIVEKTSAFFQSSSTPTIPMSEGFKANVDYFELEFLNKDSVELGDQLNSIFPLLWMQSGCIGECPSLPTETNGMFLDKNNAFAILIDETKYSKFLEEIQGKSFGYIYIVTNSDQSFTEMASKIHSSNVKQLYRDYLNNFVLNSRRR